MSRFCARARAGAPRAAARAKLTESGRSSVGAQDAEPGAGHGAQHVLAVLVEHVVLAVAEEGEVVVVHPLEQVASLGALVADRPEAACELCDDVAARARASSASPRRRRARRRARGRGRHGVRSSLGLCLAVDLDVDHRLGSPSSPPTSSSRPSSSRRTRMIGRITRWIALPLPRHLHRDRVDEERHVVDDRLDDGVRATPSRAPRRWACRRAPSSSPGRRTRARFQCATPRRRGRAALRSVRSSGATCA